jgi:ubiquinol-cytochrome c reductase cytochrome b subunit
MFRGLLYGSYRAPRELVWLVGWLIFLALMAESFFGYLLPWGQMSFWGAQVIINLFDSIPLIGKDLSLWIRGDYVVGDATLNRFFSFHVVLVPLALLALVVAHIFALHDVGSNNPDGIEIKEQTDANGRPLDGIAFHPYYSVHDLYGLGFFFLAYCAVLFFAPEMGGVFLEGNNFIPADPFQTPQHIAPLWYFTPYYSILRATTADFVIWLGLGTLFLGVLTYLRLRSGWSRLTVAVVTFVVFVLMTVPQMRLDPKLWGVVLMALSVVILSLLPWLDQSPVKSIRYRPGWHRIVLGLFVVVFLVLGYLGVNPPTPARTVVAQVCTACYFGFFFLMPWWSRMGSFKPVPTRVHFAAH